MPDFNLEPDELEPEPPAGRPLRLVAAGLVPTADVPRSRRTRDHPPCSAPCEACGAPVLTGLTATGQRLALDLYWKTYVVQVAQGESMPHLVQSRGYPVHVCSAPDGASLLR
jgi:hypothetical protein